MVGFYELAEKALAMEKAGKKIIRLNIGDTNLPTPECATNAAIESMKKAKAQYVSSAGTNEFRDKIAEREKCKRENVVVGPGSKALLFALLSVLGKKQVITPKPYWPAYRLICKQLGLEFKTIETSMKNMWSFLIPKLTKDDVLIICNPLNPTSTEYDNTLIQETINKANKVGAIVIIDEAYKGLAFKEIPIYENAIRLRSFSKEFNMEGWRIGYAIAPKEVVEKITRFNQITITCVPPFAQKAGIACLENENEILERNKQIWETRSQTTQTLLQRAGFEFVKPDGGIYIFATHPNIKNSDKFLEMALENGVVVAPGSEFGIDNFIRICLNQPEETMTNAINKLKLVLR
ncbi:MAG: pyridoxal phosphate-dependent aminotransferase [Candidatus Micrarchaeota archaeon]